MCSAVLAAIGGPAAASGGGGCGGPVTRGTGDAVEIERFCFGPTILYTQPGQVVTWTNRDGFPHVVAGANVVWGSFQELLQGDSLTYRFAKPGVYPYVCSLHPGMVGAVVVGDGGAAATPVTSAQAGVTRSYTAPREPAAGRGPVQTAGVAEPRSADGWKVSALVAYALWAAGLAWLGLRAARRRARSAPPEAA
jgi:plastocyanin